MHTKHTTCYYLPRYGIALPELRALRKKMHAHGLQSKDNTSYSGVEVDAEEFEELDHLRRQVLYLYRTKPSSPCTTYSTLHTLLYPYLSTKP